MTGPVASTEQAAWCLTDSQVQSLHVVGRKVSSVLGGPRDVEWALADGTIWVLQVRPFTAPLPEMTAKPEPAGVGPVLVGVPASPGVATGRVRLVRGLRGRPPG